MSDYISREAAIEQFRKSLDGGYVLTDEAQTTHILQSIPPHGRLIDADALKASLVFAEETAEWAVPALRVVLMIIDKMPTIIEAGEGNG